MKSDQTEQNPSEIVEDDGENEIHIEETILEPEPAAASDLIEELASEAGRGINRSCDGTCRK